MSQIHNSNPTATFWSKYNKLFSLANSGHFLYNAMSNVLFQLDQSHFLRLEEARDFPGTAQLVLGAEFYDLLVGHKIFVGSEAVSLTLMQKRNERNALCFDNTKLGLTICPTFACNFSCPYCFENSQNSSSIMRMQTMDRVVAFAESFLGAKELSVCWYGGEPTLAFDVIRTLSKKLMRLGLEYKDASLVTNGFLLNHDIIGELNDLRISSIQITLDGKASVHDRRRPLAGGRPTYERIRANIDRLMNSSYSGRCSVRVNIDKLNMSSYASFQSELLEQYPEGRLSVYPGHVDISLAHPYSQDCVLNINEWSKFTRELYFNDGIIPLGGLYPNSNKCNSCVANSQNGFVIGPEGELYKCWEDVGQHQMTIGNIHENDSISDPELIALYSIGTDPFDDEECIACSVFPICGGGCVNKRLRTKFQGEKGLQYCSTYRENLSETLETYIQHYRAKENCNSILGPPSLPILNKGYRLIGPPS
jgi:uncharacterized protein